MTYRFRDQIYQGTQGVYSADGLGDRMTVRAMVVIDHRKEEGADDGAALLQSAVNNYFADDSEGNRFFSPGHQQLPLQKVNAKQIARNLVELQVQYGGRGVVGNGTQLAKFESATYPTVIFTKALSDEDPTSGSGSEGVYKRGLPFKEFLDGLPVNKILSPEQIRKLRTISFPRTCVRIYLQKVAYGFNPMRVYASVIRKVNAFTQNVSGFTCAPGTLLLEGIRSDATTIGTIDQTGQTPPELLRYDYDLTMLYDPNGFPVQGFREATLSERIADDTVPAIPPSDPDNPPDPNDVVSKILDVTSEYEVADWRG